MHAAPPPPTPALEDIPAADPLTIEPLTIEPASVERLARGWDDQHDDLRVAAGQVAHAPTSGFTPTVARAAADFLRAWTAHTGLAAELSRHEADALRAVLGACIGADERARAAALSVLERVERWAGPR